MNKNIYFISALVLLAGVQLFIPAKMILDNDAVLSEGKAYKFKTAPVDPTDPFRGKYIVLNYEADVFETDRESDWKIGELVYVVLNNDSNGFARIDRVSREIPADSDYVEARIEGVSTEESSLRVFIGYPFTTYFMEESKAPKAEMEYNRASTDSTTLTYALVHVKNGKSVLRGVYINHVAIEEIAANAADEKKPN